ncbi:MAG TPA: alcohol dehydrogenase catalytic domain-containing protein [Armatimonadota bacterium]|nr:alcohol dehydrogenase catalytic domain-containing protein [Armatimonadota bacterium]
MKDVLQAYKNVSYDLPQKIFAWHLYGAGMENFGKDRKPAQLPMPKYGPDELLVRVDAVGICFSDIKVINQGNQHPRVTGRDLTNDPVTLGHEASVTVVGIGEKLKERFRIGQRFIVQADVFYRGKSMAFGYVLAGAQAQYQVLTKELLDGDEGCYLLPLADSTGYAEAALTEPWACVVASYRITRRPSVKPGGVLWIIGTPGDDGDYSLDSNTDPRLVIATDLNWPILDQLRFWSEAGRFELVESPSFASVDLEAFAAEYGGFDDIIVLGANAPIVERAAQFLGKDAIMNIVASEPLDRPAKIDAGKVHYQNHAYIGTTSRHIGTAYEPVRIPSELRPGGTAWFIGAGGPMGQMHVQRAVELENGPSKVLATDIDSERLNSVKERFTPIAARRGVELRAVNPDEMTKQDFDRLVEEFTGGRGFDDIVVLAPVPTLIEEAAPHLADQGLMNIFAGVPIGAIVSLDLTGVYTRQVRFVGSSGSKLSDLKDTLDAAESGQLSTNTSVAAIGGIEASWDGMLAAKEGRFPGKIVIYPQIRGLELTAVSDLKNRLPNVHAKLTDGMFWNREAEDELLGSMLTIAP